MSSQLKAGRTRAQTRALNAGRTSAMSDSPLAGASSSPPSSPSAAAGRQLRSRVVNTKPKAKPKAKTKITAKAKIARGKASTARSSSSRPSPSPESSVSPADKTPVRSTSPSQSTSPSSPMSVDETPVRSQSQSTIPLPSSVVAEENVPTPSQPTHSPTASGSHVPSCCFAKFAGVCSASLKDCIPTDRCAAAGCNSNLLFHHCCQIVFGEKVGYPEPDGVCRRRCLDCLKDEHKIDDEGIRCVINSDLGSDDDMGDDDYDDNPSARELFGAENNGGGDSDDDDGAGDETAPFGIPFFKGKEKSLEDVKELIAHKPSNLPPRLDWNNAQYLREKVFPKVKGKGTRLVPLCLLQDAKSTEDKIHICVWWMNLERLQQKTLFQELQEIYHAPSKSNMPSRSGNRSESKKKKKRRASGKAAPAPEEEYYGSADTAARRKKTADKSYSKPAMEKGRKKRGGPTNVPPVRGAAVQAISELRGRKMERKLKTLRNKVGEMYDIARPIPGERADIRVTVLIDTNVQDGREAGHHAYENIYAPNNKRISWVISDNEATVKGMIGDAGLAHFQGQSAGGGNYRTCYRGQPLQWNAPVAQTKKTRAKASTPGRKKRAAQEVQKKRDAAAAAGGAAAPAHARRKRAKRVLQRKRTQTVPDGVSCMAV